MRVPLRDGWVDLGDGVVHRGDDVRLGDAERRLLVALAGRAGEVIGRDALQAVTDTPSANALDRLVARTRAKVEVDPKAPVHLITAYGEGYRWVTAAVEGPGAANTLVGRRDEQRRLRDRLARARVVSVVGPGGVGKTALVRATLPDAPFVDLAAACDGDDLVRMVGAAFGDPRADAAWVAGRLREATTPVVLDNAEHLPESVASRVERWLGACPTVRFVVTSRVPLGIPAEAVLPIGALGPDDAAALYVARARRAGATVADGPALRRLVEVLEGLPLAIELAAARADAWPPEALAPRIAAGWLDALPTPYRDVPDRQASLDHAIAWSWDLLEPADAHALASFAVFPGAFSFEAAAATADLDAVHRLVLHGLVAVDRDAGRLRLPDRVRRFLGDRWAQDPDAAAARGRQLAWAATVTPGDRSQVDAVVAVVCAAAGRPGAAAVATAWLARALSSRQALAFAELVLADAGTAPDERAWVRGRQSRALRYLGRDDEALTTAREAFALATRDAPERWALAALELAHAERQVGLYDDAERHLRDAWDVQPGGQIALGLAMLYRYWGRRDHAVAWYERAAEGFAARGDVHVADGCRIAALDARGEGGVDALEAVDTLLSGMVQRGAPPVRVAFARAYRGTIRARGGDLEGAGEDLEAAAATLRAQDHEVPWVEVMGCRAWRAALLGDAPAAWALLDEAAPGLTGHLAGLVAVWRALVAAHLREPDAMARIGDARAKIRAVPGGQYDAWLRFAEAIAGEDQAALAAWLASERAGTAPSLPFGYAR